MVSNREISALIFSSSLPEQNHVVDPIHCTPSTKLGKNIKRIREQKDMSQGDICRAVELDRAQMSNIEAGKGNPTLATIEKIARALGVTSDELLK